MPVFAVFVTLSLLYRLVMWLMAKSEKVQDLLEGKAVVIVKEGQLAWENVREGNLTELDFFMELRLNSVEQLGQVRLAIMETDGQISVFYYADDDVKPGLCILPDSLMQRFKAVPEPGEYACTQCSHVTGRASNMPALHKSGVVEGQQGKTHRLTAILSVFVPASRQNLLCDEGRISIPESF